MKFTEYRKLAMRTNPKKSRRDNLLNACLGLTGEYSEFLKELNKTGVSVRQNQARIKDELSDIYWYVALLYETLKFGQYKITEVSDFIDFVEEVEKYDVLHYIGDISDIIKKYAFQGHKINLCELELLATKLKTRLDLMIIANGFKPDDVRAYNIEKLKERFPEGFEVDKSVNRKE